MTRSLVFAVLVVAGLAFDTAPTWASYTEQIVGGTLQVTGNGASDKLSLRLQPGVPTVLEVDVGDDGTVDASFDRGLFTAINVSAAGGNDRVRIDQSNGTFTDEAITIDGGPGNDTLLGGSGSDFFIGGQGDDFVDGNQGDDVALMGDGNDTFHWDPGDSSDVVEGQSGGDLLDFSGSNINERVEVSANGGRVRFTRDIATITMDLNDVEGIAFRALGGADTVTVDDLTGTDVETVDADLAAQGGGGDGALDTVAVTGTAGPDKVKVSRSSGEVQISGLQAKTRIGGAELLNDTLRVQTQEGDDTLSVASVVFGLIQLVVDLGPDG
jgi:hypothetical protein